jgi:hypothetical protein
MARLFPVSAKVLSIFIFNDIPAGSIQFLSLSQSSEGWTAVISKKRKIDTPEKLIEAINKAKTIERDTEIYTFNFLPQTDISKIGESPASTQLSLDSEIAIELTQIN